MKKYTVYLTQIEESTSTVEVEAADIAEAEKIAKATHPDEDLLWQFLDSRVEVDEVIMSLNA
jgi:pyrroloquinoline quinone (PQQ) biosynthesis protein C|tara:strand:- start:214 stop:399 length:186 start_codon:yes stop_codon:yes gene_type:complete